MELYKLENVVKKYDKQTAFKSKSLSLQSNKLIAIVGNSGSGKSTLLKLLANITTPTYGSVVFQGNDLNGLKPKDVDRLFREKIDVIFQEYNLIENLTVYENLELLKSISTTISDEQIETILKKLNVNNISDQLVSKISGGEAQRVAIARSLLKPTDVILADEPTGALDVENTQIVMNIFKEIVGKDKSLIYVTHDLNCASIADIIYIISDGKIIKEIDNSQKLTTKKELEAIFTQIGGREWAIQLKSL